MLRLRRIRILTVARAELAYLLRDRLTRSLLIVVPAVQILLFGYTANLNPKDIPVALHVGEGRVAQLVKETLDSTGYFRILDQVGDGPAAQRVANREALIGVELGASSIDSATVKVVVDASDPAAVRPALLALQAALWRRLNADDARAIAIDVDWLYNADGRSSWSIAPGLIGVIGMITTLLLGSLSLVRERESGAWENLRVAPLAESDVLLGKLAPLLLLALLQTALVLWLAHVLFAVPTRGSLSALFAAAVLFASAHLMLGFAISALVATQLQAIQTAVFFYLPCMLLSGFMFPFEGMPRWAQSLGEVLPLTHFVRVARGVLLRGEGLMPVVREMWPVAVFVAVVFATALFAYRRRID